MTLTKPLLILDLEATGVNPAKDRIIEIAMQMHPVGVFDPERPEWTYRTYLNPGIQMTPDVIAIHGITNEQLADKQRFSDWCGDEEFTMFCGCDLAGFNHTNFDVPMLWEEFYRVGRKWNLQGVNLIDAGSLFKKREPRTLTAAVMFYLAEQHGDAHSGLSDVKATARVLAAQVDRYEDLPQGDSAALAAQTLIGEERVDLAGKIVRRPGDRIPCYSFGNSKGIAVVDDIGFARWMLGKDFTEETKLVITRILKGEII